MASCLTVLKNICPKKICLLYVQEIHVVTLCTALIDILFQLTNNYNRVVKDEFLIKSGNISP